MIELHNRRELFLDDFLIESMRNASLALGQPQSAGSVLAFDRPWESAFAGAATILREADGFRMYYRGNCGHDGLGDGHPDEATCVIQSADGIHWHRPDLGLVEVAGSRANNVIFTGDPPFSANFAPFIDTNPDAPPDERYKAIAGFGDRMTMFTSGNLTPDRSGIFGFVSADGIHWTKVSDKPIFNEGKRSYDSQNIAFWSETERQYVMYYRQHTRDNLGPGGSMGLAKSVGRAVSNDFIHWHDWRMMDFGERAPTSQECIYTNGTQPYFRAPHVCIGLAMRYMRGRGILSDEQLQPFIEQPRRPGAEPLAASFYNDGCTDVVLLSSRGGWRYSRTFMQAFLRPGMDRRNWTTRNQIPATGVIQTGEAEMSFFVVRHYGHESCHLERMTLRLDGFASIHASADPGEVVTRPFTFRGSRLHLNYSTSAAGEVRVELIDGETDRPIPGHSLADCPPIIGDEIDRMVSWTTGTTIDELAGKPIRLRMMLKDADVYAIRFT